MSRRGKSAVGVMVAGVLAVFGSLLAIWHYRDLADKRADAYVETHLRDYKAGDFLRAQDKYFRETRFQCVSLYLVHFGGFVLFYYGIRLFNKSLSTDGEATPV